MHSFTIEIPNTKEGSYKIVTLIILLINVLVFGYLSFAGAQHQLQSLCVIGFAVNILAVASVTLKNRFGFLRSIRVEIAFIISAFIWIILGKYLIAFLMVVFAVLGLFTNKKLNIVFDEKGILYPSFPAKLFEWHQVTNAILKDDVLTIDLKNNQLFQFSLMPESLSHIDTTAFNQFCTAMLVKANAAR